MEKDYEISRPNRLCCRCGTSFAAGQEFMAAVREDGEAFVREDCCLGCWEASGPADGPEVVGVWRARVPAPREKKHLFVDDAVLIEFLDRLAGSEEPARVSFRFVLTLVLMRKKLLVYDGSAKGRDGQDVWRMHLKGTDHAYEVIDPHMDEEKIAEVSRHLGEILEAQL